MNFLKNIFLKLGKVTGKQIGMVVLSVAVASTGIASNAYSVSDYDYDSGEVMEVQVVETAEAEAEVEETEVEETVQLYLVGTSIDKDLKIKIQNQDSKVVTGVAFTVAVWEEESDEDDAEEYVDEDEDGIIYIEEIEAGTYEVALRDVEGYEVAASSISVEVAGEITYTKVDVTAEIKTEAEVNVAVEDTAVNNVEEEETLTDTVELIESTVTSSSVSRSKVDTSLLTKASVSSETNSVTATRTVSVTTDTTDGTAEGEETTAALNTEGETDTETEEETTSTETAVEVAATVTLPQSATLYVCDVSTSNSVTLSAAISADDVVKEITWSNNNTSACTLSSTSGNSVTLTGIAVGTATITATIIYYTDDENTAEQTLTCAVSVENFSSTTTLKDTSGNTLYIDSSATTVATVADYYNYETFYTKPLYTGWQTIDGKVYYFDSNHNMLTGTQVIGGVIYTFSSDGSLSQSSGSTGIDVSKWQGTIDWGAVASSGISFAIIRAGYRGSSTGALIEDPYFKQNIKGATNAGIKVGVYFFTQAITEAEAVEEASMVLSLVSGYKITYPIFIDTESATNGRANGLSTSARTAIVSAFCKTIKNAGYTPGVYASKSWYTSKLNASSLSSYCIWVAQYNSSCTYTGKYNMWQYSSTGSVSGISGNVDMNISYLGY